MRWRDRITLDPAVLDGKLVIRGTRLSVDFVLELLAAGWSVEELLTNYPGVLAEDVQACLAYASERLRDERVYPLAPETGT